MELIVLRACATKTAQKRKSIVDGLLNPHHPNLYLEEPEAHLYPTTQKDFVYSLVELLNGNSRRNCG